MMSELNGHDLFKMFQYGASKINARRQLLNDINVFPVPDGDTGNNLAMTLQTIVQESKNLASFYETLTSISESALIGARGNSGMIFAQFVNGLRIASLKQDSISLEEFAHMANESVKHTYQAVSHPVEGTMLTVIKSWAKGLFDFQQMTGSVKTFFLSAYAKAKSSLQETKTQLEVLKEKNVVDSGALGFVTFLEGINSYYNAEDLNIDQLETITMIPDHNDDENDDFRYCTEGLIKHQGQQKNDIIKALQPFGDSIIVAMGERMFRVHIHTDEPAKVFQKLKSLGDIVAQKVDDMTMDIEMRKSKQTSVIVTDSIADINPEFILKHHIAVIPTHVLIDQTSYLDKISMTNDVLFDHIHSDKSYPTTATPSVASIKDLFQKLLTNYQHILVISVSSKLSATYQLVHDEIKKLQADGHHIIHVDSLTNSAAEGLLVRHAAKLLEQHQSIDEISRELEDKKKTTEILVCLETFKYAMMGGRLPKAVGKIGMFFGVRPIMSIREGKGAAFGFSLSQKGITKRIVKHIKKDMATKGIVQYALVHCLNEPLLNEYIDLFTRIIGKAPEYLAEVSSATAIHSGKGSVAIAYIKEKE